MARECPERSHKAYLPRDGADHAADPEGREERKLLLDCAVDDAVDDLLLCKQVEDQDGQKGQQI